MNCWTLLDASAEKNITEDRLLVCFSIFFFHKSTQSTIVTSGKWSAVASVHICHIDLSFWQWQWKNSFSYVVMCYVLMQFVGKFSHFWAVEYVIANLFYFIWVSFSIVFSTYHGLMRSMHSKDCCRSCEGAVFMSYRFYNFLKMDEDVFSCLNQDNISGNGGEVFKRAGHVAPLCFYFEWI